MSWLSIKEAAPGRVKDGTEPFGLICHRSFSYSIWSHYRLEFSYSKVLFIHLFEVIEIDIMDIEVKCRSRTSIRVIELKGITAEKRTDGSWLVVYMSVVGP